MSKQLEELEQVIRRKPQQNPPKTRIPLNDASKYGHLWFDNQEDLDAYDSLMRKKVYYQNSYGPNMEKDFVFNGEKTSFGIFSKDYQERVFQNSEKLNSQLNFINSLEKSPQVQEIMNRRYHSYSTYDQTKAPLAKFGKLGLLWLVLRELPLRHFYARCFITGAVFYYLAAHNWKFLPLLYTAKEKTLYYTSKYDEQILDNMPMVRTYLTTRINSKVNSPGLPEYEQWMREHNQTFYMHHFKNYRYILRNRRVVPWDGTFNQPIFPYANNNDRSGLVHNGCNEIVEAKPSGNF